MHRRISSVPPSPPLDLDTFPSGETSCKSGAPSPLDFTTDDLRPTPFQPTWYAARQHLCWGHILFHNIIGLGRSARVRTCWTDSSSCIDR